MSLLHMDFPKPFHTKPIPLKRRRLILRMTPHSSDKHHHYFSPPSMPMEDDRMMVMMMNMNTTNPHHHNPPLNTWKLYENPFYISSNPNQKPYFDHSAAADHHPQIHRLHLPLSARKIAASFWDLAFLRPPMDHSELEKARSRIAELKVELEGESKARRKSEGLNRRLAREASEERKARQVLEKVCEDLAREITAERDEMNRMRREFEEERRMMRTAEVIREERVQMKLAEARILLEEKMSELETTRKQKDGKLGVPVTATMVREYKNPHIRRGIQGLVEFPRVVRAMGCRRGKPLGSKLECQKAQLKILLKQKSTNELSSVKN